MIVTLSTTEQMQHETSLTKLRKKYPTIPHQTIEAVYFSVVQAESKTARIRGFLDLLIYKETETLLKQRLKSAADNHI